MAIKTMVFINNEVRDDITKEGPATTISVAMEPSLIPKILSKLYRASRKVK